LAEACDPGDLLLSDFSKSLIGAQRAI